MTSPAYVTVFPHHRVTGWGGGSASDDLIVGQTIPLGDLLARRFPTDAHFVTYAHPPDAGGTVRHRRAALSAYERGAEPVCGVLAVDCDLPAHTRWTDAPAEMRSAFLGAWEAATVARPDLFDGAGYYFSRAGVRLLFLIEPVSVRLVESFLKQLLTALDRAGMPGVDRACCDWTRLFRAPRVVRDGEPLEPLAASVPTATMKWRPATLVEGLAPREGSVEWTEDLVEAAPPAKPPALSALKKLAAADPTLAEILHHGQPLTRREGQRHAALVAAVKAVVTHLGLVTPHGIMGIIGRSAQAMSVPGRDFFAEGWRIAVWAASFAAGEAEARLEEAEARSRHRANVVASLASRFALPPHDAEKALVLRAAQAYYVYSHAEGSFVGPYSATGLPATCRDLLGGVVASSDQGAPLDAEEILYAAGREMRSLIYTFIGEDSLDLRRGEFRLRVGTDALEGVEPERNPDIERWLRALGGGTDDVTSWVAALTRLDAPVAALYLDGPPGCGKGLFARLCGLAVGAAPVAFDSILGNFQEGLAKSPLLFANEAAGGVSTSAGTAKAVSDVVRQLVGEREHTVNAKYRAPFTLEGYPRLLCAANNPDMFRFASSLTREDIAAIAERFLYVKPSPSAGDVLREVRAEYAVARGFAPTSPDAPNALEEVWALGGAWLRHVAWLRENHRWRRGYRLLVEGRADGPWAEVIRTGAGAAPEVLGVIARLLASRASEAVVRNGETVEVNVTGLSAAWGTVSRDHKPKDATLVNTLRTLSVNGESVVRATNGTQRRWWPLPAKLVTDHQESLGIASKAP